MHRKQRPRCRGFCQLIAGGCLLVMVLGVLVVGGGAYFLYRRNHAAPVVVASPTPLTGPEGGGAAARSDSASPSPSASPATSTPALTWSGHLECRGKSVPVSNYSGIYYVTSLDLAKLLAPAELDRVHRKGGALYLDAQLVGQVVTVNQEELVPVDPLLPGLGLKISADEAGHVVRATARAAKPPASSPIQPL